MSHQKALFPRILLESRRKDACEAIPEVLKLKSGDVHGLSRGCLDAYFHLNEDIVARKVFLIQDQILLLKRRKKAFVYGEVENMDLLQEVQKEAGIYSLDPLEGLNKGKKFVEIAYDLEKVFDPESYPNKKKRYNRIIYPFRWIDKHAIQISESPSFDEVERLHSDWVQNKMQDPKTYRIMFPNARYLNCTKKALAKETQLIPVKYLCYGFYLEEVLVSVRILSVEGEVAFDLANFTNTWSTPSQLSNYLDTWVLKNLLIEKGIEVLNCGNELNKNLRAFKQHFPSQEVISYMYSRVKTN